MPVEPKYKIDDKVWTWTRGTHFGMEATPELRTIRSIEFNEDEDVVYVMDKFRGPFEFRFLEGRCFETKEELLKSL